MLTFEQIEQEFDDLVSDACAAKSNFFCQAVGDFVRYIESQEPFAKVAAQVSKGVDFPKWLAQQEATIERHSVGSGSITWPPNAFDKLGVQIGLMKHFASSEEAYTDFHQWFIGSDGNFDDAAAELGDQFIRPFARDFKRAVARHLQTVSEGKDARYVPASDRIVSLDHNSDPYKEADKALSEIIRQVRASNELNADPDTKARVLAELEAGQTLWKATKVRVTAIMATVMPALKWVAVAGAAGIIGEMATGAITSLLRALGLT